MSGVIVERPNGGAPTDAQYVLSASHGSLPNGRIETDTATVAWDNTVANQSKANVPDNAITNAKLADVAGFSVKGKPTTGTGDPTDIAIGTNAVLGRVAGDVVAAQVATAQIADDAVTYAKIQPVSAASKLAGRGSAAGAGDLEEITLGTGLTMTGVTLSSSGGAGDNLGNHIATIDLEMAGKNIDDVAAIRDINNNEQVVLASTASAVNEVTIRNAATGNPAKIEASGETNASVLLKGKGTGTVLIGDQTDDTKRVTVDVAGATTGTTTTLDFNQTANRTVRVPDVAGLVLAGDPGANGIMARTAEGVTSGRTITGTTNNIVVTNGDGVSGNPTLDVGTTVVQTDQANTWTTGAQDMGVAASLKVPASAGAVPTAEGFVAFDTTKKSLVAGGNEGQTVAIAGILSVIKPNSALSNTGAGGDQLFTWTHTLPANSLTNLKVLDLTFYLSVLTDAGASSRTYYLEIGGTKVYTQQAAITPFASVTRYTCFSVRVIIDGAPGVSVPVYTFPLMGGYSGGASQINATAQPVNRATNGSLDMKLGLSFNTTTGGETDTLLFVSVEAKN